MTTTQISRRMFGGIGAAGVTAILLAACGSDSPDSTSSSGASGQGAASGGKLTLAYNSDGPHKA